MEMVFYSNNYYGHLDLTFYLFSNLLKLESWQKHIFTLKIWGLKKTYHKHGLQFNRFENFSPMRSDYYY